MGPPRGCAALLFREQFAKSSFVAIEIAPVSVAINERLRGIRSVSTLQIFRIAAKITRVFREENIDGQVS